MDFEDDFDIDDDDSMSSDSLDYDGTDNWPLHADCKYDLTQTGKEAWVLSPRSLKHLAALNVVTAGLSSGISCLEIPKDLYQTLFIEACRLKCGKTIASLVSTWPDTVLNLQNVEIPLDCYRGYYTRAVGSDKSLACMIIDGLLQLKSVCRLKKVILPESEAEGAALMKLFLQLPQTVLKYVPMTTKEQWIKEHTDIEAVVTTCRLNRLPDFKEENFERKISDPVIITLPGIIQRTGRNHNYLDVLLGLSLCKYSPFVYQFERLCLCNTRNMDVVRDTLCLINKPEMVQRLRFVSRTSDMFHAYYYFDILAPQLQRYTALESVVSTTSGRRRNVFPTQFDFHTMCAKIKCTFSCWRHLQDLDLGANILFGTLGVMLHALETPLKRLNISATDPTKTDLISIADSHHASSLVLLNLDHNNLHKLRDEMRTLLQRTVNLVSLRTCNCELTYEDSVAYAKALSHSHTLKTWNLLQNRLFDLSELKQFVQQCSQIPSLKEVGCKPLDFHMIFAEILRNYDGPYNYGLTDDERQEFINLASRLNLMVF